MDQTRCKSCYFYMGEGFLSKPSESNPEICIDCEEVVARLAHRPPARKTFEEIEREVHAEFKKTAQDLYRAAHRGVVE